MDTPDSNTHTKMAMTIAIFAVVVALIVVGARMVPWNMSPGSDATEGGGTTTGENGTSVTQTDEEVQAIIRVALDTRSDAACDGIQSKDIQSYCHTNVAITKASDAKDPTMCDPIQDAGSRTACKDNIIIVRARDSKNPSYCELMTDQSRVSQCKVTAR